MRNFDFLPFCVFLPPFQLIISPPSLYCCEYYLEKMHSKFYWFEVIVRSNNVE